eukprot:TRINITY_DN28381_c0_g1_i1.p1 TRINITY_DN28381_c0_g1~~TRINITY_DN28381_c0_g1_i1.p1  ORF type:complete len:236 (+),score=20.85 TRINITY_DN28381_c0_g1_i1:271-978(+)
MRAPSLKLVGLPAYKRFQSMLHWSLHTTCTQSKMQITSLSGPGPQNEINMRWRLQLWPRFVPGLFAPAPGEPYIIEGYSRYELHPWSAEIIKHTLDITNPPMYVSDFLARPTVWMSPSVPGSGVPYAVAPLQQFQPHALRGASHWVGRSQPAASKPRHSSKTGRAALPLTAALPQFCEDDFECNDGKANFPLQCCKFPVLGNICCEPDDFETKPSQDPAYVPLPVPAQEEFEKPN